jgi:hypothetical protein
MARWKFWDKPPETPKPEPATAETYRIPPRKDAIAISPNLDPELASRLRRLRQRRASVLYDVERAEEATQPDNPWDQRVSLIDEAIHGVEGDLKAIDADRRPGGAALPPVPIENIKVALDPPPSVSFSIDDQLFRYEEDLDWAERGNQIARSDLIAHSGDPAALIPETVTGEERSRLFEHLTDSLFVFATALRDAAVENQPFPDHPTLADLAKPSAEHGDWLDWSGDSPEKKRRDLHRAEMAAELERFRHEQAKEIEERARWEDRLPIARRRLAEIDAEIANLHKSV